MTIDRTDPYTRLNPRPIPTEDYTRELLAAIPGAGFQFGV